MKILVLCPKTNLVFQSIARACHQSFIELGHESDLAEEYVEGYDLALFVVYYHPWRIPNTTPTLKIGYHMEPLPWYNDKSIHLVKWAKKFEQQTKMYDRVIDMSYNNVEWLRSKGHKRVYWCALGYHESFELPRVEGQHHEVAFIGSLQEGTTGRSRRQAMIKRWNNCLAKDGIKIKCFDGVFDDDLASAVHNADIHLNIHISDQRCFEMPRIVTLLLSNGKFVITEKIGEHKPFTHKKHLVEVSWKKFPSTIRHYLKVSEQRNKIARQGYEFVKKHYRFRTHLNRMLRCVLA